MKQIKKNTIKTKPSFKTGLSTALLAKRNYSQVFLKSSRTQNIKYPNNLAEKLCVALALQRKNNILCCKHSILLQVIMSNYLGYHQFWIAGPGEHAHCKANLEEAKYKVTITLYKDIIMQHYMLKMKKKIEAGMLNIEICHA